MTGDVINDGRQIYFTPTSGGKPSLYGGPLSSTKSYVFDHLEFKFGLTTTTGSEHTLDGKQYPMEIQLVFYDQSAHIDASAAGASSNADAVVALSYFVETDGTTDNSALASIITAVEDEATLRPVDAATTGNAQEIASKTLKLKDLLGDIDTVKIIITTLVAKHLLPVSRMLSGSLLLICSKSLQLSWLISLYYTMLVIVAVQSPAPL